MALTKSEKLLAIGLDLQTASRLVEIGWTAAQLRRATTAELTALGVSVEDQKGLNRPPIPLAVLSKILHQSKRTCCVCRITSLPIIVHHIEEWHSTRDHAATNLAVLCLNHHGGAHTTSTLSQNLTPTDPALMSETLY